MQEQLERMRSNLERFTAVAKAATKGDWTSQQIFGAAHGPERCVVSEHTDAWGVVEPSRLLTAEDADYIATFDPPMVLKLLSGLAHLMKVVEQLDKLEGITKIQQRRIEELERGR